MSSADFARLVALAAVWGLAFIFIRVAVQPLGPLALVELRALGAAVVLVLYLRSTGRALGFASHWRTYLTLALFNSALPFVLIAAAEIEISASLATILVATTPLFAAFVARLWIDEPLPPRKLAGLALGVVGVALLVGWNPQGEPLPPPWAIAAALGAALLYGIAGVYTKLKTRGIAPLAAAAGSQLGAALLLLPFIPLHPPVAWPTPTAWACVFALALLSSALAFILYFKLIERVGPVKTLTVNFLAPLFGIAGGALLLDERITLNMIAGALAIFAAMGLVIGRART